jgi:peptidoglycan hydrolase CwlO-like protein
MLQIKTSLDWSKTESELKKLGKMLPMFNADVKRITNRVNDMVKELSQLEVTARNTRSRSIIAKCESKVATINEELKQIQKFHLMSILSNS